MESQKSRLRTTRGEEKAQDSNHIGSEGKMGNIRHLGVMCGKPIGKVRSDNLKPTKLPKSTEEAIGNLFRAIRRLDGKTD